MAHSGERSALDVGAVIAGTYAIEALLGKGGMGAVFLASHARLPGKKVAIKVLHPDVADTESLARFRREAEIASRLGHAHIVEVHDFNVLPDGTPYLVLEYLQGESLAARLARGPLTLDQAIGIVRQVGSALAAAHREDIVHRDLKPQNVFIVQTEGDHGIVERAKVLDFGISKIRGSQTIKTQDTSILGTPQYMAPEQALGQHDRVDARTDVFALGAMVYEMLCGQPAFAGASVPEVVFKVVYEETAPLADRVPGLPPHVTAAIHRALAKKPEERWPDVASFVEALTGQPLVTGRRPLAIAPGDGATPSQATAAALANTIDSGDHARQLLGTDRTVAAKADAPPTIPTVSTPRRGRGGLVVAVVAIVAAAAVAIAFLATRQDAPSASAAPVADAAPVAVVVLPDAAPVAVVPADAAPVDATVPDAAPRPPPKDDPPDEPDPPAQKTPPELARCTALLADPEDAIRCANKVLERHPRSPEAHVIRGRAFCDLEDQEKAITALRKIGRRPAMRRAVISYCRRKGIALE